MRSMKKSLAAFLSVSLVCAMGITMSASAATVPTAQGQTVISRRFVTGSLNADTWQKENGAVTSFDNVSVLKDGTATESVLIAGTADVDDSGEAVQDTYNNYSISDKSTDGTGYIIYKLNISKTTKSLSIGMECRTGSSQIKVYTSSTSTFGDTPAAIFTNRNSMVQLSMQNVSINESGTDTAVYVKIVLPYIAQKKYYESDGTTQKAVDGTLWECGIYRLHLSPEITAALHTTDTNPANTSTGTAVIDARLVAAKDFDDYTTWANGMYSCTGNVSFKDSDGAGQMNTDANWSDGIPETSAMVWKFTTVSAIEEMTLTWTARGSEGGAATLAYSTDGENYTTAGEVTHPASEGAVSEETATYTISGADLNNASTVYIKATMMTPSWSDWAWVKALKVETKGFNPTSTTTGSSDTSNTDTNNTDNGNTDTNNTDTNITDTNITDTSSTDTSSPATGVGTTGAAVALLVVCVSGTAVLLSKKKG